jgi:glutamate-5-semialdehyde dehydrogenase
MPEVCNALETVLVDECVRDQVPEMVEALSEKGVAVRGCPRTQALAPTVAATTKEDWPTEYLGLMVSMRVVPDIAAGIDHINKYGSRHTDAIVTEDYSHARRFVREVDSAVVLVNASTMFCDGESLGMGAEIAISTDKLHARGPMGLRDLTSYKSVIEGSGQTMGSP